ncbi:MAG: Holliday junction resolvase-like protein [Candidatus Diapherotrites archaeon]
MDAVLILLIALLLVLAIALIYFYFHSSKLEQKLIELNSRKISQSVKYGQLTEQWIPFTKDFPFNPADFKFLGKPIDGIVFDENEIVFCEFKTNKSMLNESQKRIKSLVKEKKVNWMEYRID